MNTLNKLKQLMQLVMANFIPLLFLIGLTLINVACYLQWGITTGLITTGVTFIVITFILVLEQGKEPPNN